MAGDDMHGARLEYVTQQARKGKRGYAVTTPKIVFLGVTGAKPCLEFKLKPNSVSAVDYFPATCVETAKCTKTLPHGIATMVSDCRVQLSLFLSRYTSSEIRSVSSKVKKVNEMWLTASFQFAGASSKNL